MFSFGFLNELPADIGRITFQHVTIEKGVKTTVEIPHYACRNLKQFDQSDHVKNLRCLNTDNQ